MTRRTDPPLSRVDVAGAFDVLRQNLARADAMLCATENQLERFTWGGEDNAGEDEDEDGCDDRRLDHLAHLLGAAKEAVRAAVYAGGQIAAELAKHRTSA